MRHRRQAEKKLAGAAKTSFIKKCEADAHERLRRAGRREEAGRRGQDQLHQEVRGRRQADAIAACDAKAAEKKLAGAAKTSFTKKCVADAKAA